MPFGLAILLASCAHSPSTSNSKISALSIGESSREFSRAKNGLDRATIKVGEAAGRIGRAADRFGKAADKWLKGMKEPISGKIDLHRKRKPPTPRIDNRAFVRFFDAETGRRLSEADKRAAFESQVVSLASKRANKLVRWHVAKSKIKGRVTAGPVFTVNGGLCRAYSHVIVMPDKKRKFERIVCHSSKYGWQIVG